MNDAFMLYSGQYTPAGQRLQFVMFTEPRTFTYVPGGQRGMFTDVVAAGQ
jgi:hypothetical protein